ncbi:Chaperone_protein DnaJ [Hexamita inflata]|uniref:Chaperone protein DnaJ n=1 Tax=Hexamita inflata TaxID=28002 RepID=A0AA86NQL3_9EUKA|nr:Chaperone protein DnaJ [Hexamita inflata]
MIILLTLQASYAADNLDYIKAITAFKKKEYQKAIDLCDQLIQAEPKLLEAYFVRGKAHHELMHLELALNDFKFLTKKSKDDDMITKVTARVVRICNQSCQFECSPEDFFFAEDEEKDITNKRDYKNDLEEDETSLRDMAKFVAENCSLDEPLVKKIFFDSLAENYYDGLFIAIASFKQLYPLYKQDMYRSYTILKLLKNLHDEDWAELSTAIHQVLPIDDDTMYWKLQDFGITMKEAAEEIQDYVPERFGDAELLQGFIEKLEKIDLEPVFDLFQKTVEESLTKVLGQKIVFDINVSRQFAKDQVLTLTCFKDLTLKCNIDTLNARYANGLRMLNEMKNTIINIRNHESLTHVKYQVQTAQKQIPIITETLSYITVNKKINQTYLRMSEVVDFFDDCADHLFLLDQEHVKNDHYAALNISKEASQTEIKQAYFAMAKYMHPDTLPKNLTDGEKEIVQREYEQVQEAYDVLSDPDKKNFYDLTNDPLDNYKIKRAKHDGRKRIDRGYIVNGRKE